MSVKLDFNMGTIVTVLLFLIVQSGTAVWLMSGMNADIRAMRAWQIRQDDRLAKVELTQDDLRAQELATATLVEIIRVQVEENGYLLVDMLKGGTDEQ